MSVSVYIVWKIAKKNCTNKEIRQDIKNRAIMSQ